MASPGHESGFVQPASFLRPRGTSQPMTPALPESALERDQRVGLQRIREFLKVRTSYDVLPLSFRLIIFDTSLLVKKSLSILIQNGIVSAPLWDSKTSTYAGLLTTADYINLIQYYWQNPEAVNRIDQFKLNSLRDIEKAIGVAPLETVSIHPQRPLYEACRRMLESRARRIPLVDIDDETKRAMVVSVVTQYRILKFVAVNVGETQLLRKPLKHLKLGTYKNLETAKMETPVFDIIHQLVNCNISAVPILNSDGVVTNVFEAVDIITLIKGNNYDELNLDVGEALKKRADDFPGIYTCSINDRLDIIFDTIRKSRVHRLVVIDDESRLVGILSLSDILEYILLEGESEDDSQRKKPLRRKRSSLDKLVISRRTRLPSSKVSHFEAFDRQVAMNLLNAQAHALPTTNVSSSASHPLGARTSCEILDTESGTQEALSQSSGSFYFRNHTRGGSTEEECHIDGGEDHHSRHIKRNRPSSSSSGKWENHELGMSFDGPNEFASNGSSVTSLTSPTISDKFANNLRGGPAQSAEEYSSLAKGIGLPPFSVTFDHVSSRAQTPVEAVPHHQSYFDVRKVINKIPFKINAKKRVRRTYSSQSMKSKRHGSGKVKIKILECTSLMKLCRLGGCGTLKLPHGFSPVEALVIPSSLAAMANYIVDNGPFIPGIFRVSGNHEDVQILYDYFATQYQRSAAVADPSRTQYTVRATELPSDLSYTVLEVAEVYKKVVRGIPGGLLGSLQLLKALTDILYSVKQDTMRSEAEASTLRVHLIALALSAVALDNRFSVICATLGLFAWIGHATEAAADELANMNYKNLSIILSPILVGHELNKLKEDQEAVNLNGPEDAVFGNQPQKDPGIARALAHENTKEGQAIALILLSNWKAIAKQLRILATNAAATLREKDEEQRLANADSKYTLDRRVRFPKDSSQSSKAFGPSGSSGSQIPNGVLSRSNKSLPSLRADPRHLTNSQERRLVYDGTGGQMWVSQLYAANDGNKTRGRSTRLDKPKKPEIRTFTDPKSESMYVLPEQQQEVRVPSGPVPNNGLIIDSQQQRFQGPADGLQNGMNGIIQRPAYEMPKRTKAGPPYQTTEHPQDDEYIEDIPSEDRLSDYGILLSTEPSRFGGSDIQYNNEFGGLGRDELVQQTVDKLIVFRATHKNQLQHQHLTSAGTQPPREASGQTLMDRPSHSAQSSLDITKFAEAQPFSPFGSAPRRRGQNNNGQVHGYCLGVETSGNDPNDIDAFGNAVTGSMSPTHKATNDRIQSLPRRSHIDHNRNQMSILSTGSQTGSVRQLAQRFDQPSQEHYVSDPTMSKSVATLYGQTPILEYSQAIETPTLDNVGPDPNPPFFQDFDDTPTPRARAKSSIPKPRSDVGRPRRKGERQQSRSPSPTKLPTPTVQARQRPPVFNIFTDNHNEARMLRASHPSDVRPREPLSTKRGESPRIDSKNVPSACLSQPTTPFANSTASPVLVSKFSSSTLDQEASDSIPSRPLSLDSNLPTHRRADSQLSRRRNSTSQNGDEYSGPAYANNSANMGNNVSRHGVNTMAPGSVTFLQAKIQRMNLEMERKNRQLEESQRKLQEAERREKKAEELKRRKEEAKDIEKGLKRLKDRYDDHRLIRDAQALESRGGRVSVEPIRSWTMQEMIEATGWDVETQGPYPYKLPSKEEQRLEEDYKVLFLGRRAFDYCRSEMEERRQREELKPWMDRVVAQRGLKSRAEIDEEFEEFKVRYEKAREWGRAKAIERRFSRGEYERTMRVEQEAASERQKKVDEFDGMDDEEKSKKIGEKFEKILVEEFGVDEKKEGRNWFGKRKSSGNKSGESQGRLDVKKEAGHGKVKGMAKLFGGGRGS